MITNDEVQRVLQPWLSEADCGDEEKFSILGSPSSKRFVIQFKGTVGLAQRRARKAHELFRDQDDQFWTFPGTITSLVGRST